MTLALWACGPADAEDQGIPSAASAQLATDTRVCSWNIRRLGHRFEQQPKDMEATASIIRQNCDVLAVQEVMVTGGLPNGYNDLVATLGGEWSAVITAKAQPNDPVTSASEHYAFFLRKTRAAFCSDWTAAKQLNDEEGTFSRAPAWACVKIEGRSRELLLVGYHATFGSIADRRREVGALDDDLNHDGRKDDVLRAVRASRGGDQDVIVVGDYNLTPPDIATQLPTWKDLTVGTGSTLNIDNQITANLYDHVLIPPDQPSLATLQPAEVLDVRSVLPDRGFFLLVSDHLPLRFMLPSEEAPRIPAEDTKAPAPVDDVDRAAESAKGP